MFPFFPSLPSNVQAQGQQMMLPNVQQQVTNPLGFNNMQQIAPQFHAQNGQFQNPQMQPFNNQSMDNMHGRSMVMPNHSQLTSSASLGCIPNVPNPVQTSVMGMQQPQNGHSFFSQHPQNVNQIAALPFTGQICNVSQALNQLGMQQLSGLFGVNSQMQNLNQVYHFARGGHLWPQNLNQAMGFHGQFYSQNLMLPPNQIQQSSQHGVGVTQISPSSLLPVTGLGFQDNFSSNSHQSGFANASVSDDPSKAKPQGLGTSTEIAIASQNGVQKPLSVMQNMLSSLTADSAKMNDKQRNFHSDSVKPPQVSHKKNSNNEISAGMFGNSAGRSFNRDPHGTVNRDHSQRRQFRFQKPNHHMANTKENSGSYKKTWGKGLPTALNYSEEEVRQWREARRKNFPSTANVQRQLKEVLAKQMELGFEAAEVPSSYLLDLEKEQPLEARSTNKRGKRGRGSDKWQSKKQRTRNGPPPPPPAEPTLLQKLLNSEIKRDRSRLLQAFRFMAMNAFFDHWPSKSLEYPLVTVGASGGIEGSGGERTQLPATAEGAAPAECSDESDCVTDGGGAMEEEEDGAAGGSEKQGCSGEQPEGATELKG
ncbi:unnamed protein product [Spirodela intermedia]|uniref:FMR1-interacting protein 1 conserved domain-containing protein n=1 Tax=Spirodela intermedia TaxID=51605 RepID=A0A7I8L7X6_SPIIN|nr:unnamed protein product [Spirodela intermedia]